MQIPSYQISNVIKVYSKQLSQNRALARQDNNVNQQKPAMDRVNISAEGKRQTIVDKVSDDVLSRITRYGPQDSLENKVADGLKKELKKNQNNETEKDNKFVFNFLGKDNQKQTNSISIDGSKFIAETVEKNIEV